LRTVTGEDPYRILGLDAEADEEQVRRAYFRAVRCCPPEVDVQGFTRVRQAYELLRDPARRAAWDAQHVWGGTVAELMARASQFEGQNRPARAEVLLKRALVLAPGHRPARLALVRNWQIRGRYREAIRELDRLLQASPEDGGLLFLGALVRRQWAEAPGSAPRRIARLAGQARDLLRRLERVSGDPAGPHVVEMARLELLDGLPERALEVLERGLPAVGMESDQDAPVLALLCQIHWDRRDFEAIQSGLRRLKSATSDPGMARVVGLTLGAEALRRARRGDLAALRGLVRLAESVAGEDPEVQAVLEVPRSLEALMRERAAVPLDRTLARRLLGLEVDYLRLPPGRDGAVLEHWNEVVVRLLELPPRSRRLELEALRLHCPTFCGRNQQLFQAADPWAGPDGLLP